jgi:hypothetical protein
VLDKLEKLAAAGIQLLPVPEITTHYVLERDGFVALVVRAADGFGEIGSPGLMTDEGFAALVWRGGRPFFVAKKLEQPADGRQVEMLRRFASDLEAALH